MKNEEKFTKWLKKLKKSGKSEEEIGQILAGVAKYSGLETYSAIMLSLTEEDMNEVEKIDSEYEAKKKVEELFKLRTGMTLNELVGKVQTALIEREDYLKVLNEK